MTLRSKTNNAKFDSEYDRIFGEDKKPERGSWVQDSVTGEFIPKADIGNYDPQAPAVHGGIEAFVSPIDKTVIDDRAKLRQHNARHGVTNVQDYGENGGKAYFDRHAKQRQANIDGNTREAKAERVETIKRSMAQHGYT